MKNRHIHLTLPKRTKRRRYSSYVPSLTVRKLRQASLTQAKVGSLNLTTTMLVRITKIMLNKTHK